MAIEFNFTSQIATTIEQSERLIALGLRKETADMVWLNHAMTEEYDDWKATPVEEWDDWYKNDIPAWSLHRLIEILDTNPYVFYTNCGYDTVIDHVEEYIRSGFIDTRYLEEWCLNEEE